MNIDLDNWTVQNAVAAALFDELCSEKILFDMVLVGRSGVGKTSTLNSLLEREASKVDKYRAATTSVGVFPHTYQGFHFRVTDTCGLCDDLPEMNQDQRYVSAIRDHVKSQFCMLYVTELDKARIGSDEKRAMKQVSEVLGKSIWERAVVVFTGADRTDADSYVDDLKHRSALMRAEIALHTSADAAARVPCMAISNRRPDLPDGEQWQPALFRQVLENLVVNPTLRRVRSEFGSSAVRQFGSSVVW
jgi:predicted GTPase